MEGALQQKSTKRRIWGLNGGKRGLNGAENRRFFGSFYRFMSILVTYKEINYRGY